jgi:WhiB family redox-sensing transcriptional regulator
MAHHSPSGHPVTRHWRDDALCATTGNPDLWFPIGTTGPYLLQIEEARAICRACPVMAQCQEWALATSPDDGIWGGLDANELRLLRRRERRGKGRPDPMPCGTLAAYRRHLRHGEPIDRACREANRLAKEIQDEQRKTVAA